MTPEEEIARYKQAFAKDWPRLEALPEFQEALRENDPVKVGEIACRIVKGDKGDPMSYVV